MKMPCKKIDVHAHVIPTHLAHLDNKITSEELFEIYEELNIEKAILLPFLSLKGNGGRLTTENAAFLCEKYPERFARFTTVSLSDPELTDERLEAFLQKEKAAGALGVGEITTKLYFDDERVNRLFRICGELQLPLLFHLASDFEAKYGVVDGSGLRRMEAMLRRHPKTLFIGHAPTFWKEISSPVLEGDGFRLEELLSSCENLYCDLSAGSGAKAMMKDPDYAACFLTRFSHRVFYGCDICQATNSHFRPFASFFDGLLESGAISSEVYERVARENALRLLFKA